MFGFKVIRQYENGIVLHWGKAQDQPRGPGLTWVNPVADRLHKVNLQVVVTGVEPQDAITKDNVTVTVDAVVYYRVVDAMKAFLAVENYHVAVGQVAQTSLRSVIGKSDLDELLSNREGVNDELKTVIDEPTEGWGVRVERVEVKDVSLPEAMKRSMSRQAEAERERRARVIAADGEFQASRRLADAAAVMDATPTSLQLRLLQTVVEVAAEKNSTLVMPFPVEILRFFEHHTAADGTQGGSAKLAEARRHNGAGHLHDATK
jgi:regulator of protease activity HflC (stomatin/prohibitin superfamily)